MSARFSRKQRRQRNNGRLDKGVQDPPMSCLDKERRQTMSNWTHPPLESNSGSSGVNVWDSIVGVLVVGHLEPHPAWTWS